MHDKREHRNGFSESKWHERDGESEDGMEENLWY